MESSAEEAIPCKVVLLGNSGVGKTSICSRWVNGDFQNATVPTIGVLTSKKSITVFNHPLEISLWDTAGQEQYHSITPLYARSATSIIIATSIDDPNSFDDIQVWSSLVKESVLDIPPTLLAINKVDLENSNKAAEYLGKYRYLFSDVIVCSAKTGEGIDTLFKTAAVKSYEFIEKKNEKNSQKIASASIEKSRKTPCC